MKKKKITQVFERAPPFKNKFILTIKYKFKNNINFTGNDYGN